MRTDVAASLLHVASGDEPGSLVAEFCFDPALPVFRGHFPGRPLVPGAFELEMARLAVERHTGRQWRIARVRRARFTGEIVPGDTILVSARSSLRAAALDVKATLSVDGSPRATLSMALEPAAP